MVHIAWRTHSRSPTHWQIYACACAYIDRSIQKYSIYSSVKQIKLENMIEEPKWGGRECERNCRRKRGKWFIFSTEYVCVVFSLLFLVLFLILCRRMYVSSGKMYFWTVESSNRGEHFFAYLRSFYWILIDFHRSFSSSYAQQTPNCKYSPLFWRIYSRSRHRENGANYEQMLKYFSIVYARSIFAAGVAFKYSLFIYFFVFYNVTWLFRASLI